jgi:hypothetical protein
METVMLCRKFIDSCEKLLDLCQCFESGLTDSRIRIQQFKLNTDPYPGPILIQGFYDQKWKKFKAEKNLIFF